VATGLNYRIDTSETIGWIQSIVDTVE
jgi:hypothetical protein